MDKDKPAKNWPCRASLGIFAMKLEKPRYHRLLFKTQARVTTLHWPRRILQHKPHTGLRKTGPLDSRAAPKIFAAWQN